MKYSLVKKFLSTGLQAISVQVIGGFFFFIVAKYLSKDSLGIYTWSNGVALAITMLLSYGLDQVIMRRIAASDRSDWAAAAYFFHAVAGTLLTLIVLFLLRFLPGITDSSQIQYVLLFFLSQALIFIANPLKQLLNAKQKFTPYAIISLASNIGKLILALVLIASKLINLSTVTYVLIGTAGFELLVLLIYLFYTKQFSLYFKKVAYKKLLKEATPQYIAVIFDAVLARADVILLGIICTAAMTAEYGFAYRIYEIAKLPLSIISPVLLARFAPMLNMNNKLENDKKALIQTLLNIEVFLAMFVPLILGIVWSPLLDYFFDKKFGTSNEVEFLILSVSIPIHFYINMLWTLAFASKKTAGISRIIAISAVINIVLNLILIPVYGGMGAAVAYLITTIIQLIGYLKLVEKHLMSFSSIPFLLFLITGTVAYFAAVLSVHHVLLQLATGIVLYIGLSLVLKLVNKQHLTVVKNFLKK